MPGVKLDLLLPANPALTLNGPHQDTHHALRVQFIEVFALAGYAREIVNVHVELSTLLDAWPLSCPPGRQRVREENDFIVILVILHTEITGEVLRAVQVAPGYVTAILVTFTRYNRTVGAFVAHVQPFTHRMV